MPLDKLISDCAEAVSQSIFEICLKHAKSPEQIELLSSNIQRRSEDQCRDFFSRLLAASPLPADQAPSTWTPRIPYISSNIVFSEIMHVEKFGDYKLRCEEFMVPEESFLPSEDPSTDLFSSSFGLFPSPISTISSSWIEELGINTLIVFSIGGFACYLFGPAKIVEVGSKIARFTGLRRSSELKLKPLEICGKLLLSFFRVG